MEDVEKNPYEGTDPIYRKFGPTPLDKLPEIWNIGDEDRITQIQLLNRIVGFTGHPEMVKEADIVDKFMTENPDNPVTKDYENALDYIKNNYQERAKTFNEEEYFAINSDLDYLEEKEDPNLNKKLIGISLLAGVGAGGVVGGLIDDYIHDKELTKTLNNYAEAHNRSIRALAKLHGIDLDSHAK